MKDKSIFQKVIVPSAWFYTKKYLFGKVYNVIFRQVPTSTEVYYIEHFLFWRFPSGFVVVVVVFDPYAICTPPCTKEWGQHAFSFFNMLYSGFVVVVVVFDPCAICTPPCTKEWGQHASSFLIYVILLILNTKQTPVNFIFSAPKWRKWEIKMVVLTDFLVKMTRHENWCLGSIFQVKHNFQCFFCWKGLF